MTTYVDGFHYPGASQRMPYKKFGETDMELSLLGFGGGGLSGFYEEFKEEDAVEIVREALKNGINYIDTAPYYGEGRSETVIGKALKGIPRKAYYISTKVGRYTTKIDEGFNYSPEKIKSRFEISLRLLGLEYVDMIIIHDVEFAKMKDILEEVLPTLQEIVKSGKARYMGISGYPLSRLWDVINRATIKIDFVLSYSRDTLIDSSLDTYYPLFKSKGLGIINASATAMQMLTNAGPQPWHPASDSIKQLCAKAADYCKEKSVELGILAIHHTLSNLNTETLLIGMNSMDVLQANLELLFNKLSPTEEQVLNYIQQQILNRNNNLNWEGVELKKFNMVME
ncbi:uncharacterized protein [Halyomorpha halys]|uniref:uncharacterized protein n=1 Tax=Halyomorpha halys TaxID=286706 RepID=UPI0006D5191D|nr:L-galactose dehydrogenase [Halyomorpha halys]